MGLSGEPQPPFPRLKLWPPGASGPFHFVLGQECPKGSCFAHRSEGCSGTTRQDCGASPGYSAALWGPLQALGPERALGGDHCLPWLCGQQARWEARTESLPQHHAQPLELVVAPWGRGARKHQPGGLSEGPWAEGAPWPALSSWPGQAGSHPSHLARSSDAELLRQDAQGHSGPPAVRPAASGTPFRRWSVRCTTTQG